MESAWWEFVVGATAVSVFTLFFWNMGSLAIARDVKQKIVPNYIAGFFYMARDPNKEYPPPNPESGKRGAYIVRGMAIATGLAFILGFEIDLWINVINDDATFNRAMMIQLYMFLPFVLINVVLAYIFQRYIDTLPEIDNIDH